MSDDKKWSDKNEEVKKFRAVLVKLDKAHTEWRRKQHQLEVRLNEYAIEAMRTYNHKKLMELTAQVDTILAVLDTINTTDSKGVGGL